MEAMQPDADDSSDENLVRQINLKVECFLPVCKHTKTQCCIGKIKTKAIQTDFFISDKKEVALLIM
eukprot:15364789-Ditylum_brightwellii.AAC.2